MAELERVFQPVRAAFTQERTARLAWQVVVGAVSAMARRTVTGMLCAAGRQHADWSSVYRLFERGRFDRHALFAALTAQIEPLVPDDQPLVVALDDTAVNKRGRKVHGAKWRADRKGPHFQTNLVWAQRYLQVALALPEGPLHGRARMLPVDFVHCPTPPKPRKGAPDAQMREWRRQCRARALPVRAVESLARLAPQLQARAKRTVIAVGDGGFTNKTLLRNLPPSVSYVGRTRKDACMFEPPEPNPTGRGRPRMYGKPLPTPDRMRTDPQRKWNKIRVHAGGKMRTMRIKSAIVRWPPAGARDLRLIIIAPMRYRNSPNAKPNYREPAYLVATDPTQPVEQQVQAYIWRWEIEQGFHDEKQLLGVGQAAVRTPAAVENLPAFLAAVYTMLHLACHRAGATARPVARPKWRKQTAHRTTTAEAITMVRADLWQDQLNLPNLDHFAPDQRTPPNPIVARTTLQSAVLYAQQI